MEGPANDADGGDVLTGFIQSLHWMSEHKINMTVTRCTKVLTGNNHFSSDVIELLSCR
jgi:hypothetical protein